MSRKQKRKVAQQNGVKAAGAKTHEGIQKSSANSLKHGLLAKTLVLANESQTKFDSLMQSYVDRFQLADEVELGLVNQMVAARWRQQRLWMIQTAGIDLEMDRMQLRDLEVPRPVGLNLGEEIAQALRRRFHAPTLPRMSMAAMAAAATPDYS